MSSIEGSLQGGDLGGDAEPCNGSEVMTSTQKVHRTAVFSIRPNDRSYFNGIVFESRVLPSWAITSTVDNAQNPVALCINIEPL